MLLTKKMVLVSVLAVSAFNVSAGSAAQLWSHKDWTLNKFDKILFAETNGQAVKGNTLRLVFNNKTCQRNAFLLSLSSNNIGLLNLKDKTISARMAIDGGFSVDTKFNIRAAQAITDNLYVASLSSEYLSRSYQDQLKKGHKLQIEIDDSPQVNAMFDIKYEVFSLDGFAANYLKMDDYCLN
ncbi:hypothetical protein [Vibrio crassostreae]|nr:hypothetical protein [Vibrio crassostreae]